MAITKRFISFFIAFAIALTSPSLWSTRIYAAVSTASSPWVMSDKTVNPGDTINYTQGMEVGYSKAITFKNDGVVNVTGGAFNINSSSTFENNGTFNFTGSNATFSLGYSSASFINNGTATIKGVYNFEAQNGTSFINNGTLFMEDISNLNLTGFINNRFIVIPDNAKNSTLHLALERHNSESGRVYTQTDFENQKLRYPINYEGLNADNYSDFENPNPPDYEWAAADPQDITLAEPTLGGYEFLGWTGLDIDEPTKSFTFSSSICKEVTVTAHWKPIVYTITYDLDGGSFYSYQSPPEEYKRGAQEGIPSPYKDGYTFNGWIDTDTGKQVSTADDAYYYMPPSALGNKTYKASFIANSNTKYTIICYYQNIDGTTYGWTKFFRSGETGAQVSVSAEDKDYAKTGFTFDEDNPDNLLSGVIKGDKSLELKLYFNRNKYDITFKSQDGSETLWTTTKYYNESIGEYGGEIPSKTSDDDLYEYVFDNWAREEPNRDFGYSVSNVIVKENITFYAAFKKVRNENIVIIKWEQYDGFKAPAQTEIRLDRGADYTVELQLESEKYYVGTREWIIGFQEAHIYWNDAESGDHGANYELDKESFDAPVVLTIPNVQHDIFIKVKAKHHEEHDFSPGYDEIIENGGCINDSIIRHFCYKCGKKEDETVSAEGHAAGADFKTDKVSHWKVCNICNEKIEIEAHTPDAGVITREPTHNSTGTKTYTCTVCHCVTNRETLEMIPHTPEGDWQSGAKTHYKTCSCGKILEETPHSPDEGTVMREPTYDDEGMIEYRCTVCGYFIGEKTIAPLGHNIDEEWQKDISGHWQDCRCGEKHNFGEHISDGGLVTIQPTYDSWGERVFSCKLCGYVLRTETILPLSHKTDGEWVSDKDNHWKEGCGCGEKHELSKHISDSGTVTLYPTYTEEGKMEYRCTVCGYLIGEVRIDPLGHNIDDEWQSDKSGHWQDCECGEKHNFGEHISDGGVITTEATYNSSGERVFSCTVCGYVMKTEAIPPLSHKPDDDWVSDEKNHWKEGCGCGEKHELAAHTSDSGTVTLEPTYDDEGKIEYRCTVCGYVMKTEAIPPLSHKPYDDWVSDENNHWKEGCGCGEKHELAAHTPDNGTVTLEPTYDDEGKIEYHCTVCGYVLQIEAIPPLSHKPYDDWVFDENNHWKAGCGCGEKHELAAHTPDNGTVTLEPTYDDEGKIEYHCTVCGYVLQIEAIPPLSHKPYDDWVSDENNHWKEGCGCGKKHELAAHTSDSGTVTLEPTYDDEGKIEYRCTVCGYVLQTEVIPPLSHKPDDDWVSDENNHWKEGCGCGEKHELAAHTSDSGTVTLEPTYDDEGIIEYRCTVCGYVMKTEAIPPLSHKSYDDWVFDENNHWKEGCGCGEKHELAAHTPDNGTVTLESTYDDEGKIEYRCTVCGYLIDEEAIAPLGHNISDEWQSDESGHWQDCECGEKHNFSEHISDGGVITAEATYDSSGERMFSCTVCGYVLQTEIIPPLSHKPDDDWVSDENNHWKEGCGCSEKHELAAHTPDNGTVTLEPTYNNEGEIEYRCTACGYIIKAEIIPALSSDIEPPSENPDNNIPNDNNPETGKKGQPWELAFFASLIVIIGTFSLKRKKSKAE